MASNISPDPAHFLPAAATRATVGRTCILATAFLRLPGSRPPPPRRLSLQTITVSGECSTKQPGPLESFLCVGMGGICLARNPPCRTPSRREEARLTSPDQDLSCQKNMQGGCTSVSTSRYRRLIPGRATRGTRAPLQLRATPHVGQPFGGRIPNHGDLCGHADPAHQPCRPMVRLEGAPALSQWRQVPPEGCKPLLVSHQPRRHRCHVILVSAEGTGYPAILQLLLARSRVLSLWRRGCAERACEENTRG